MSCGIILQSVTNEFGTMSTTRCLELLRHLSLFGFRHDLVWVLYLDVQAFNLPLTVQFLLIWIFTFSCLHLPLIILLYSQHHRQSVSSMSGPLQVVPDIDDQVNHSEHMQEVRS